MEAAKAVGVQPTTIARWKANPDFRRRIVERNAEHCELLLQRLVEVVDRSLGVVLHALQRAEDSDEISADAGLRVAARVVEKVLSQVNLIERSRVGKAPPKLEIVIQDPASEDGELTFRDDDGQWVISGK